MVPAARTPSISAPNALLRPPETDAVVGLPKTSVKVPPPVYRSLRWSVLFEPIYVFLKCIDSCWTICGSSPSYR